MWQRAMDVAEATHNTVETFSREQRYAYGDQFRRAAISIAANISEGAARKHRAEFLQFLAYARGSLAELHALNQLAVRVRLCPSEQTGNLDELIDHVGRMLTKMMQALGSREPRAPAKRMRRS